jgi:hypothetical protein
VALPSLLRKELGKSIEALLDCCLGAGDIQCYRLEVALSIGRVRRSGVTVGSFFLYTGL